MGQFCKRKHMALTGPWSTETLMSGSLSNNNASQSSKSSLLTFRLRRIKQGPSKSANLPARSNMTGHRSASLWSKHTCHCPPQSEPMREILRYFILRCRLRQRPVICSLRSMMLPSFMYCKSDNCVSTPMWAAVLWRGSDESQEYSTCPRQFLDRRNLRLMNKSYDCRFGQSEIWGPVYHYWWYYQKNDPCGCCRRLATPRRVIRDATTMEPVE